MLSFTDTLPVMGDLSVPFAPAPVNDFTDDALLAAQRAVAEVRRRVETQAAVVAAEIAHRSRRELGHTGLAATRGVRTAEDLIATVSGTTRRDARTLVKAGELQPTSTMRANGGGSSIAGADDASGVEGAGGDGVAAATRLPAWLTVLGDAVATATLTVEAAEVIRTRLGAVTGADQLAAGATPGSDPLTPEQRDALDVSLADAAQRLVAAAAGLTVEQLAVRASRVRDDLDLVGVAARERELHEKRYLRVFRQADGMTRIHGLLDPESAAIVVPVLDAATSPRRGGPRFVDPDAVQCAEDIVRDTRSTDQVTLDTLVELVRMGARVDDGRLLGERKPTVRILVTKQDLDAPRTPAGNREGAAFFEGHPDAVSIETTERHICAGGAIPILFDDDGRVLNLGREQRLFSEKQRLAMAARDGGWSLSSCLCKGASAGGG